MTNNFWYHPNVDRQNAEELLRNENIEYAYLVRNSTSSEGDYVLSVMKNNEVIHFQIRKHGDDAIFSIEDNLLFHGLDSLMEYYQDNSKQILVHLSSFVKGERPPVDSIKHGRTNLLHRATKEGNLIIVSELLKCGYRLESKNQDGQTAIHIASMLGHDEILKKLIINSGNVNCYDLLGYTPLHYACINNSINTVRILLQMGNANVQARHLLNNWVPMHECAFRGYTDIIRLLLAFNAPLNPRTADNLTPLQLAKKSNCSKNCIDFLENYIPPSTKSNRDEWFHGTLDRFETVEIMRSFLDIDGAFLIRYSEKVDHSNVLSLNFNHTIYHFLIHTKDKYYFIDNGPLMKSLEEIVDYYSLLADGLPINLQFPIKPKPKPPLPT